MWYSEGAHSEVPSKSESSSAIADDTPCQHL